MSNSGEKGSVSESKEKQPFEGEIMVLEGEPARRAPSVCAHCNCSFSSGQYIEEGKEVLGSVLEDVKDCQDLIGRRMAAVSSRWPLSGPTQTNVPTESTDANYSGEKRPLPESSETQAKRFKGENLAIEGERDSTIDTTCAKCYSVECMSKGKEVIGILLKQVQRCRELVDMRLAALDNGSTQPESTQTTSKEGGKDTEVTSSVKTRK